MRTQARQFAVVVSDPAVARSVPDSRCFTTFRTASEDLLENWRRIFVLVSLGELESVSDFVSKANRQHNLCALLVDQSDHFDLLPQFLHHTRVRTLRNMLIHSGPALPRRVLNAYCIGAEDELIADAQVVDDLLFIVSCASESFTIRFDQMRALRRIGPDHRAGFQIAADGSYLHWVEEDVHITLEAIRTALDPELATQRRLEHLLEDALVGTAIRRLRKQGELRQTYIEGLSERQVRRIESGGRASVKALAVLAAAHDMTLKDYANRIAQELQGGDTEQSSIRERSQTVARRKVTGRKAESKQKPKGKVRKKR